MIGRPKLKEEDRLKRETVRFGNEYQELKQLSKKGELGKNIRQAIINFIEVLKGRNEKAN